MYILSMISLQIYEFILDKDFVFSKSTAAYKSTARAQWKIKNRTPLSSVRCTF